MSGHVVAAGLARGPEPRAEVCVWPTCEKPTSAEVDVPLCDRHAIKTYRAIAARLAA